MAGHTGTVDNDSQRYFRGARIISAINSCITNRTHARVQLINASSHNAQCAHKVRALCAQRFYSKITWIFLSPEPQLPYCTYLLIIFVFYRPQARYVTSACHRQHTWHGEHLTHRRMPKSRRDDHKILPPADCTVSKNHPHFRIAALGHSAKNRNRWNPSSNLQTPQKCVSTIYPCCQLLCNIFQTLTSKQEK